jgi:hypothetical protein
MPTLDPFESLALSVHQNPGVYALLVGSGLSRAAGIPSGWEITLKLIERLGAVRGAGDQVDWAKWYRDTYNEEPSYSDILDALASTPAERRNILHGYIEPKADEEARRPTKAHHAIAQLVANGHIRVIVTPNFDRLLETALREAGVEPTVVASEDAVSGATPLVHSTCTVIKVHGDYLDLRIRNTQAELAKYPAALDLLLDEIFDSFGLITVGWSGEWDEALRAAIRRTRGRRYPFFWVSRGNVPQIARDLIGERDGRVVTAAGADEFFGRLADVMDALRQSERPHPQSVTMAVALAKKYCREDRYALEWSELLAGEVAKIRSTVDQQAYVEPNLEGGSIKKALQLLANCGEGFRRLCMICGRWGARENRSVSVRAIRSLVQTNTLSGLVAWNHIRDIPASLAFYWFTVGAMQAGDYDSVRSLFRQTVHRDETETALIERLPLHELSSDIWSRLDGFPPYTWSSWLHSLFRNESRDIALAGPDTEAAFDDLEFLVAVEGAIARSMRIDREKKGQFHFPLGRFVLEGRQPSVFDRLAALRRINRTDARFQAGLFGGIVWQLNPTLDQIEKELREHTGIRRIHR